MMLGVLDRDFVKTAACAFGQGTSHQQKKSGIIVDPQVQVPKLFFFSLLGESGAGETRRIQP